MTWSITWILLCMVVWVCGGSAAWGEGVAEDHPLIQIPANRWVAAEGQWIINDGGACDVRGLTRTHSGDLLLIVMHTGAGGMEEQVWRSTDDGRTWAQEVDLVKVHQTSGMTDELTTLRSGRVIARLVEPCWGGGELKLTGPPYDYGPPGRGRNALERMDYSYPNILREKAWCIYSDDEGRTWKLTEPLSSPKDLERRLMYGRLAETPGGDVLLPGHTFTDAPAMRQWIFSSCYLRSTDGGLTWSAPQIIARGEPELGNCYNETSLMALGGSRLFAFFRMNPTHYGHAIYGFRSFSTDDGRTWSPPEQCLQHPGETDLGPMPDGGMIVTGVSLSGGEYTLSYDGGRSWAYQGHFYDRHPGTPKEWDWHYSYTVLLDDDTALTVYNRLGKDDKFGTYGRWLRREPAPALPPQRTQYVAADGPDHRWVIREVHHVAKAAKYPQLARDGNGNLLLAYQQSDPERTMVMRSTNNGQTWSAAKRVAAATGYGLTVLSTGTVLLPLTDDGGVRLAISRDQGRSWRVANTIPCPGLEAPVPAGPIVKHSATGDLLLPVHGTRPGHRAASTGLLRSTDGGTNWGAFTILAAEDDDSRSYSRTSLLEAVDGTLIAAVETRYPAQGDTSERDVCLAFSTDAGRSWTQPIRFLPGFEPHLARLPDGSVFCAQSVWTGLHFEVSHNDLVTFAYQDQLYYRDPRQQFGAGSPTLAVLDADTALVAYHLPAGGIDLTYLRRVPRFSKEARERFE